MRKRKFVEPIVWSLEDWCRDHREELWKYPGTRVLVHPELGILVVESARSEVFMLKVSTIRRSVARDCKIFLVSEMLHRLNTPAPTAVNGAPFAGEWG